ncbi:MAG: HD domain-containing phosphohydrolase [Actinomycetota bacterium]
MTREGVHGGLLRFLPHALTATAVVSVCPLLVIYFLEDTGVVDSVVVSIGLGTAVSLVTAMVASWSWARMPRSRDIVFGDLMLWGYLKRLRNEKTIAEILDLIDSRSADASGMDAPRRIEILKKLASALEARDPYTHGHTGRVAHYSHMIAKGMRLTEPQITKIWTAAAVHDVGKVHISDEVLNKPGKLTDDEFAAIKEHAAAGAVMVATAGDDELTALVRHHHERIDGRGYPDRLAGDEIPLGARIIAVADTFDAITSTRSYRSASSHKKALEILTREAGHQLDETAVDAFLAYYSGRSSRVWWGTLTTAPQRLLGRLTEWLAQAGMAGATNVVATVGIAASLAAPLTTKLADPPNRSVVSRLEVGAGAQPIAMLSDATSRRPRYDDPSLEAHRASSSSSGDVGYVGSERARSDTEEPTPEESSGPNSAGVGSPPGESEKDGSGGGNGHPPGSSDRGSDGIADEPTNDAGDDGSDVIDPSPDGDDETGTVDDTVENLEDTVEDAGDEGILDDVTGTVDDTVEGLESTIEELQDPIEELQDPIEDPLPSLP